MKRLYYHGTSAGNLASIKANGLKIDQRKVWNPSLDEIYLWSPDEMVKHGECEEEYKHESAKQRAYESAQVTMARDTNSGGKCVVFEIELDESEVAPDHSCENMTGAVSIGRDIEPREIKRIFLSPDLSMISGYFLAQVMGNSLFDWSALSDIQVKIAKVFSKSDFYIEVEDFPLEELN